MSILWALIGEHWQSIAAFGAAILGIGGVYLKGRGDANTKHKVKKAKHDAKAHERINKRNPVDPADRDSNIRRLRKYSK